MIRSKNLKNNNRLNSFLSLKMMYKLNVHYFDKNLANNVFLKHLGNSDLFSICYSLAKCSFIIID